MDTLTLEQKQAQFDEFFMIAHRINVNVVPLAEDAELPPHHQLEEHMPYAFRIATEMADVETKALRPLRQLGDHAQALAEFLNHQSRKIDLMMSFILHQQDDAAHRMTTVKFGGGGMIVSSEEPVKVGQLAEIKLFLDEEAAAIYCFGEVISCQQSDNDYHIAFFFNRIREQDQELLVRASLHLQSQQLRKRTRQQQDGTEQ
ncbi:PilZ domain-containing protein [Alteromonas sp. ASW11-19]|uniref:PilZ domain-containing protein n=1 Tax=Alteromonas salexigens TaxID=2982530 RepID=A0ABT2VNT0_9ALTE|nr:PilZ domain-containing protein [Alteromonas salexigens]MCU7553901.1 PilZ domain-containing protein [Alteromonas salexigens]